MNAKLRLTLPLVAVLVGWVQSPAWADDVDVSITATATPTFYVNTDGAHYTELVTGDDVPPTRFEAELSIEAGHDRIMRWSVAPHMGINGKSWGWRFDSTNRAPEDDWGVVSKSYGVGERPSSVHRHLTMPAGPHLVDDFVVQTCNDAADHWRSQGQGNAAIFSGEHVLEPSVSFQYRVTYRNRADIDNHPMESTGAAPKKAKIVCMKYEGAHHTATNNVQAPVTVAQATLVTIEKTTAGGLCKVILSGVIETNVTNAEVKFRYEHNNGKKSDLKTVATDFSKTVMFSDTYDVPNNPDGDEVGMVRMVGENIAFQSGWSVYQMHCTKPGPKDLQAVTLPTLDLTVAAGKTEMVNGQICPTTLLMQALVTAGSAFDGKGLFLGDAFFTAPQAVSVGANKVQHLFANRALNWGTDSNFAGTLAGNNSPSTLKTQKVRLGFNLADTTGKLVGQVPQKWYTVTCKKPGLNPDVSQGGDGMVSQPKDQQ